MNVGMNRQNPREYEVYRHFKGTLYQIVTVAVHSESGEEMVVYRNLYEPSKVYVRPLAMFMSVVDSAEYPNEAQKYRFEKFTEPASVTANPGTEPVTDGFTMEEGGCEDKEPVCIVEQHRGKSETDSAEPGVNPLLLEFLDLDTYESRLNFLVGFRDRIDDEMLNAIAVSLDIEFSRESFEEKYEEVKSCLVMMEKYECNRLR